MDDLKSTRLSASSKTKTMQQQQLKQQTGEPGDEHHTRHQYHPKHQQQQQQQRNGRKRTTEYWTTTHRPTTDRFHRHYNTILRLVLLILKITITCLVVTVVECSSATPPLRSSITTRIGQSWGGTPTGTRSSSGGTVQLVDRYPTNTTTTNTDNDDNNDDTSRTIIQEIEGKVTNKIDLSFDQIELVITKKENTKNKKRYILDGSIRGRARPGRLLAIMGPSGSGKSTILNALAGRIKESPSLELYGNRYVNGIPLSGSRHDVISSAIIEQDVTFFPYMTVRETLSFRVELKLGSILSKKERDRIVNDLLEQMSLTKSADTIVGNNKVRGISGGEKKRLSIAVELVSSPSVLFLDEPTSGLDSTAASSVVQKLRDIANTQHKTVVAVIHQPSQHVFNQFDDLLLVSDGKLMYYGERAAVRNYMDTNVCKAPVDMGTAEHILDCITASPMEHETTNDEATARITKLATLARKLDIDLGVLPPSKHTKQESKWGNGLIVRPSSILHSSSGAPRASVIKQFRLLLKRSVQEVLRGKGTIVLKLIQQITTAMIYGGIYSIGTNQASIMDRYGLLNLLVIGSTNLALAQTIRSFPKEKVIVATELATKLYRTLPYFLGKAISELPVSALLNGIFGTLVYRFTGLDRTDRTKYPKFMALLIFQGIVAEAAGLFIGSISPNSDVALALFPAVIVLSIIFDGKNISEENTPKFLRWISKIGLIRWGYEGLCINEFTGLQFDTKTSKAAAGGPPIPRGRGGRPIFIQTGEEALARFGLHDRTITEIITNQAIVAASCWILSYIGLSLTKQRYEIMQPPHQQYNK